MKKQCCDCTKEGLGAKDLAEFGKLTGSPDGRQRICRVHIAARHKKWYQTRKEKFKDRFAEVVSKRSGIELEIVRKVISSMKHLPPRPKEQRAMGPLRMADAMRSWR